MRFPWRVILIPLISFLTTFGSLRSAMCHREGMFKHIDGYLRCKERCRIIMIVLVRDEGECDGCMPKIVPSIAADTVPEYVISSPRFAPLFIPDTTRSGFRESSLLIPSVTQSLVCHHAEHLLPDLFDFNGLWSVSEWPAALLSLSGATIQASPSFFMAI